MGEEQTIGAGDLDEVLGNTAAPGSPQAESADLDVSHGTSDENEKPEAAEEPEVAKPQTQDERRKAAQRNMQANARRRRTERFVS